MSPYVLVILAVTNPVRTPPSLIQIPMASFSACFAASDHINNNFSKDVATKVSSMCLATGAPTPPASGG